MYKIILLIFFLVALSIIPFVQIYADPVYLGVQITATQPITSYPYAPQPGKLWCLPKDSTVSISRTGFTTVTTILQKPICPGDTVGLGPANLVSGNVYTIRVHPVFVACSGFYNANGDCYEAWDTLGQDKDCDDVCGRYGQTAWSGYYTGEGHSGCSFISWTVGRNCTSCTANLNGLNYYSVNTGSCSYSLRTYPQEGNTTWSDPAYIRVCKCNWQNSFNNMDFSFSYTAP